MEMKDKELQDFSLVFHLLYRCSSVAQVKVAYVRLNKLCYGKLGYVRFVK